VQLEELRERVAREGYDLSALQLVPQRWPEDDATRSNLEECS
jgi:hypothetical protein